MRDGDYITLRGVDNAVERSDAIAQLRRNGCKSVRLHALSDGRLQAHGYLRPVDCPMCQRGAVDILVGEGCIHCTPGA